MAWLAIMTSFILFLAYLPSLKTNTVYRRHDKEIESDQGMLDLIFSSNQLKERFS